MPKSSSRRFLFALLAAFLIASTAGAQGTGAPTDESGPSDTKPASSKVQDEEELAAQRAGFGRLPNYELMFPSNLLSVGVRISGGTKVEFAGVGAIANPSMPDDSPASNELRIYSNGGVGPDARTDLNNQPIPPDGKTNSWAFASEDQIAEDGSGIYMTAFSTSSDGSVVRAESGYNPGFDIELSRRIGGKKIKWGVQAGIGLSDINAKTTGDISASVRELTDFYSLLGAAAPEAPYEAPDISLDIVTNPDGSVSTVSTDVSVLISDLPVERIDETIVSGAQISGFWQVKGAYFSARLGSWVEMPLGTRFTVRASGGVSGKVVGAFMRFDERFILPDEAGELTATDQTNTDSWAMVGGYAAVEAQYWLTERSGFFAGASYEAVAGDVELRSGERVAKMNLESGAGVRLGFTTRF
ncbi:MAG TPA: hypothetical protein VMM36_06670 [Opitutaceae bacterium]|nr:hypothetical protein [Opitutaceae bacterium]